MGLYYVHVQLIGIKYKEWVSNVPCMHTRDLFLVIACMNRELCIDMLSSNVCCCHGLVSHVRCICCIRELLTCCLVMSQYTCELWQRRMHGLVRSHECCYHTHFMSFLVHNNYTHMWVMGWRLMPKFVEFKLKEMCVRPFWGIFYTESLPYMSIFLLQW